MKSFASKPRCNGFCLFEMLTFLAVLGIIVGLILPTLTSTGDYELARNRRNAQEVAVIYSAAQIAGLNLEGETLEATIRKVMAGGSPAAGVFKNQRFSVGGVAESDVEGIARHLSLKNGQLIYSPTAIAATPPPANSVSSSNPTTPSSAPAVSSSVSEQEMAAVPPSTEPSQPAGIRKRMSL